MRKKPKSEFWISNITKKDIKIADLGFYIPAGKSLNLLSNNFKFTYLQIVKSAQEGSLYNIRDRVKVRLIEPPKPIQSGNIITKIPLWLERSKLRASLVVQEKEFEELNFSDESFAEEMSSDDD